MATLIRLFCCYLHHHLFLWLLLITNKATTLTPSTTAYPPTSIHPNSTTVPRPPSPKRRAHPPQYYMYHLCTPTNTTTAASIAPATSLDIATLINSSTVDPSQENYVSFAAQQQSRPPYQVFGHFLCTSADFFLKYCLDCLQAARDKLIETCHTDRTSEAIVYFEDCMLRYSTRPFFFALSTTPVVYLKSLKQAAFRSHDPTLFNLNLTKLLKSLEAQVAGDLGSNFASDSLSVDVYADDDDASASSASAKPDSSLMKGKVHCTGDLDMLDCEECIREAVADVPRCCNGILGARIIRPSCILRYDLGDFYQSPFTREVLPNGNGSSTYPTLLHFSSPDRVSKRTLIAALSSGGAFIVLIALAMVWLWRRKSCAKQVKTLLKKKSENSQNVEAFLLNHGSLSLKRYKYSDVKKMTNSFQDKLGQGGYGSVYKGSLLDGRMVAVKLLSESKGDGQDFINELASISRTSHVNIVALLGFCVEDRRRALVYEFMQNGSLEKFIYGSAGDQHLGWKKLYDIAIGIARGLEYLHRGCSTKILHFDIKPHNILLDQDFSPKISDFGLSKLCLAKESAISMTGARGTAGYIAPELISRNFGAVSHKSDVYSYGMMVLEIVGGRKNVDVKAANTSQIYFPKWIFNHVQLSEDLQLQGITAAEDEEIARKMVLVGLWCIQIDPSHRPPMNKVLEMLEGSLEALQIPPSPFLSSPPRAPEEELSTISVSSSKPRECDSFASTS